jgi:hypothetical protein
LIVFYVVDMIHIYKFNHCHKMKRPLWLCFMGWIWFIYINLCDVLQVLLLFLVYIKSPLRPHVLPSSINLFHLKKFHLYFQLHHCACLHLCNVFVESSNIQLMSVQRCNRKNTLLHHSLHHFLHDLYLHINKQSHTIG